MSSSAPTIERRRFARPPRRRTRRGPAPAVECRDLPGGTLEDVVITTLAEIGLAGRATCPACLAPSLEPAGCTTCGSHLS